MKLLSIKILSSHSYSELLWHILGRSWLCVETPNSKADGCSNFRDTPALGKHRTLFQMWKLSITVWNHTHTQTLLPKQCSRCTWKWWEEMEKWNKWNEPNCQHVIPETVQCSHTLREQGKTKETEEEWACGPPSLLRWWEEFAINGKDAYVKYCLITGQLPKHPSATQTALINTFPGAHRDLWQRKWEKEVTELCHTAYCARSASQDTELHRNAIFKLKFFFIFLWKGYTIKPLYCKGSVLSIPSFSSYAVEMAICSNAYSTLSPEICTKKSCSSQKQHLQLSKESSPMIYNDRQFYCWTFV